MDYFKDCSHFFLLIILGKRLNLIKIPMVEHHVLGFCFLGNSILCNDQKSAAASALRLLPDSGDAQYFPDSPTTGEKACPLPPPGLILQLL